jgi:antitoxin VapB
MPLSIKNPEVERLAAELARLEGVSRTEAIRRALLDRRARLDQGMGRGRRGEVFLRYLREEVWPAAPPGELGRRLTSREQDELLGYGPEGV